MRILTMIIKNPFLCWWMFKTLRMLAYQNLSMIILRMGMTMIIMVMNMKRKEIGEISPVLSPLLLQTKQTPLSQVLVNNTNITSKITIKNINTSNKIITNFTTTKENSFNYIKYTRITWVHHHTITMVTWLFSTIPNSLAWLASPSGSSPKIFLQSRA